MLRWLLLTHEERHEGFSWSELVVPISISSWEALQPSWPCSREHDWISPLQSNLVLYLCFAFFSHFLQDWIRVNKDNTIWMLVWVFCWFMIRVIDRYIPHLEHTCPWPTFCWQEEAFKTSHGRHLCSQRVLGRWTIRSTHVATHIGQAASCIPLAGIGIVIKSFCVYCHYTILSLSSLSPHTFTILLIQAPNPTQHIQSISTRPSTTLYHHPNRNLLLPTLIFTPVSVCSLHPVVPLHSSNHNAPFLPLAPKRNKMISLS